MTDVAAHPGVRFGAPNPWPLVWAAAFALAVLMHVFAGWWPWAIAYPDSAVIPFARWVGEFMAFLQTNLTWFTRGLAQALDVPLDAAFAVLARGYKIGSGTDAILLPRLSWLGVCAAVAVAGYSFGGPRLAALGGGCLLYIALFGQWESAMLTLGLIIIAVPFCVAIGLLIGVWAWRNPRADAWLVTPALDLMQTMPTFAYLIPMLLLFGNSPVSAMLATAIFATPPMVRATTLALSRVPPDLNDFGDMAGCTGRQKLWRILLPSGRATLML
ncbi:MAG: ABC transporter permease subunit, partial [Pseudomonadota bacterium]|nr:ABC transporter permease subunit [Pseudomonadota bacterium]